MNFAFSKNIFFKKMDSRVLQTSVMKFFEENSFYFLFFNWDSLHARLNSHYEAWSYKKKKHKKVTSYRKSV